MLIDMHAHSRGISTCCKADAPRAVADAKGVGIDGLILCNHYHKPYLQKTGETPAQFAARYLAEYAYARECGKQADVKVFFGIEVTMERHDRVHMLVYGVEEDFVTRYPEMYEFTQRELYELVHANGGILVQAHPMRGGKNVLLDPNLMDGIEVNSHPKYDSTHVAELSAIAREHGILLTSGGDYHADTHRARCGVYLPDDPADTRAIIAHLQGVPSYTVCCQEPAERESRDVVFAK